MIYHSFAQLYDQLFDPAMYSKWRDFTVENIPAGADILDLAGGSGRLAVMLAPDHQVTVADFSADMLSLADQHAAAAGVDLQLVEVDMRDLHQLPTYDAITCYADSLCYLENPADVQATFTEVANHLRPAGVFLFDLITPYQTDEVYPGYMYNYQDDDGQRAFMWQSYANDDVEHGVIHDLTFFNRLQSGDYQRVSETHYERTYDLPVLEEMLKNAGFKSIAVGANFTTTALPAKARRWFFKCQK
ncbi:class I SAM-dependent DNA methyltransferase [Limosilactobacillus caccae]|uniref:class I SAM-dependent DNA methyltransferase n=1 Tax=Limosilactobacillus caccae TaxID=1926284 RepID=UPI0009714CE8|nr:class I SAM-dependent methyltransferase [Limosilactobacillus caccae]